MGFGIEKGFFKVGDSVWFDVGDFVGFVRLYVLFSRVKLVICKFGEVEGVFLEWLINEVDDEL